MDLFDVIIVMLGFILKSLWDAWVAQSVERPTSAQVMISRLAGSSPHWALC